MSAAVEPITPEEIHSLICKAIPDARVKVHDMTGGGDHYEALVISSSFAGKTKVNRHRMVYGALQEAMVQRIHALALTTVTPEELQREQSSDLVELQVRKVR